MTTSLHALAGALALGLLSACAQQQPVATAPASSAGPEVTLTRLDCGSGNNDQRRFSDTFAYSNPQVPFTFSCYVIKHGSDYMVWDTGYLPGSNPNASKVSLGEQLASMNVRPEQVKFVGISHFHADHTGQLATVPGATLLIGGGKVEPQAADKDVFGDGTVMVLRTPGHTPGHQSLLVRLKDKGPVVLVGDAAHFHENYQNNGVPGFNFDRAQTIASMERIKEIEKNLKATVIIQHDPRDIGKLPTFPAAAR
jgi:N-acyl homoserine lactone hydrolase